MINFLRSAYNAVKSWFYPSWRFGHLDKNVQLFYPLHITNPKNTYMYEHTKLGRGSTILNTNARFIVKKYAGIAENLTAITGNHPRPLGRFYRTVTEADKGNGLDKDIIIHEDVWIGANVTILAGVEIGRGATVAAGAVVSKSLPPYSLSGGIPAKVIKFNFTVDEILEHEKVLYEEHERFSKNELLDIWDKYAKNKK